MVKLPSKLKILNLSTVHRWNDPRIFYKEALTLEREHEVIHAAIAEAEESAIEGVRFHPLGSWKSRWERPRLWLRAYREIWQSKADVVHFHDPELALLLLPWALLGNKKFVCDIHEHPKAAIAGREWIPRIIRRVISALFSLLLRSTPRIYDEVVLAEERYGELFSQRDNISVILNHALIPDPDIDFTDRYGNFNPSKELRLIYVGSLTEDRGALKLIDILSKVREEFPHATLDLIGKIRPDSLEAFLKEASLKSSGQIRLYGYLDFAEISEFLKKAHIGLIPLQPHPNYTISMATKFYDYMIYGLPFVASDFPLWKSFVDENPCGLTADSTDPEDFASAILSLAQSRDSLVRFSRTGYRLVREKFSWKTEADKLLELYSHLEPKERT